MEDRELCDLLIEAQEVGLYKTFDLDSIDEIATVAIKNVIELETTQKEIEKNFQSYDRCEDDSESFREMGWGTHSFVQYLIHQ